MIIARNLTKRLPLLFITLLLTACMQRIGSEFTTPAHTVTLKKISPHAWVHVTYQDYKGVPTPSNGLIIETSAGLIMVDTPWTVDQTTDLLALVRTRLRQPVVLCIATHAHQDRIGGIAALIKAGIPTRSTPLTADLAVRNDYPRPQGDLPLESHLQIGGQQIQTFYAGPGHTADNIVVYLAGDRVLFGGCLVKSASARDMGNTADADLSAWPATIRKVQSRFPHASLVVPGHGATGGLDLLTHTVALCQATTPKK